MNKIDYAQLVTTLRVLEKKWRGAPQSGFQSRWIRSEHKVKFFACRKVEGVPERPLVVDVGINYTQRKSRIPDQSVPHTERPAVEDSGIKIDIESACIRHFIKYRALWVESGLASRSLDPTSLEHLADPCAQGFNLVMTNLSPWITTKSWQSGICEVSVGIGAELLVNPPHLPSEPGNPFGHLDDLYDQLSPYVSLWIGHGLSTVTDHFRLFVAKHGISEWLIVGNLASGCVPTVVNDEIKFVRPAKEDEPAHSTDVSSMDS